MYPKKERVKALLVSAIKETELLLQMSGGIHKPDDYLTSLTGMTVYRACGMSLQFITESLVKIRNLCGLGLFKCYPSIPWNFWNAELPLTRIWRSRCRRHIRHNQDRHP